MIIAQGTIECVHYSIKHGISMNIAGGTHHAFYDRGEAFCMLNDQAIAAKYLINKKLAKKIMIIDLDVHQGNGSSVLVQIKQYLQYLFMVKTTPLEKKKVILM